MQVIESEATPAARPRFPAGWPEDAAFPGELVELRGNRPVVLGPGAWLVERGEVDVFSMRLAGDAPRGPRRHLVRVGARRLVLGAEHAERGMVAVGLNGARLVRASPAALRDLLAEPRTAARARSLVDDCVEAYCRAIAPARRPTTGPELAPGRTIDVAEPSAVHLGGGVCWVKAGPLLPLLLGREELPLVGLTPIAAPAWLTVAATGSVATTDGGTPDEQCDGLARLAALVRAHAELIAADEDRASVARAEQLAEARRATMQRACDRLAKTIHDAPSAGREPLATASDSPLVHCCRIVGAALGVAIKPPSERDTGHTRREPFEIIMRSSRLRARRVALRGDWWEHDQGPLVAFVAEPKRPVALTWSRRGYQLHDPAAPSTKDQAASLASRVDAATAAALVPFAYTIYRPFPETRIGVRDLLQFAVRGSGRDFVWIALMTLCATFLGMVPSIATGLLFENVIPAVQRAQLWQMTMLLVAIGVAGTAFVVFQGLVLVRIQQRTATSVQAAVWDRLMRLPLTFFRPYTAGELAMRAMSIDSIQQILSGATLTALLNGFFSLGNLVLMFQISTAMAWRAVLLLAVAIAVTLIAGLINFGPERAAVKLRGKTKGLVLQLLTSISKLRVAGAEARAFAQWVERFAAQRQLQFKIRKVTGWLKAFTAAFPVVASALIYLAAVPELAGDNAIGTGEFLAFGAAFTGCLWALLGTCAALIETLDVVPLYDQARPILHALPEACAGRYEPGVLSGEIEVQHAVFRYSEDGPPTLRDVSFHIRPGEFVAFVGPSGSGKSTLLKLLLGFETLESGSIFYDGQDITGLDILEVRRQMGVVLQSGRLVVGDIYHNIIGSGNATLEQAWDAAKLAGIADDIQAMPMKMHTMISEQAGTLSGGQKQRIMIARAIVNRPRLLLFDEATSALDNRTQALVTASLEKLQATRIVVAHRLSTIVHADRIYVFERGRIVQTGSYGELMKEPGPFAELARRQLV